MTPIVQQKMSIKNSIMIMHMGVIFSILYIPTYIAFTGWPKFPADLLLGAPASWVFYIGVIDPITPRAAPESALISLIIAVVLIGVSNIGKKSFIVAIVISVIISALSTFSAVAILGLP